VHSFLFAEPLRSRIILPTSSRSTATATPDFPVTHRLRATNYGFKKERGKQGHGAMVRQDSHVTVTVLQLPIIVTTVKIELCH
jgi:hypothetical protein